MNIWYLNAYAGGPGIGSGWRPYYLCREFNRSANTATVITSSFHHLLETEVGQPAERVVEGVQYFAVPTRRYRGNGAGRILNMLQYALGVARLHKDIPHRLDAPDAIIVSSPHPFAYISAWFLSRRFRCRLAFEIRDLWPLSLRVILGLPAWHPLVLSCSWLERFAYRTADVVVALLPGADRYIACIGMEPKRFYWAPNGVVDGEDQPQKPIRSETGRKAAAKMELWRTEGRCVLIYAGSLGPPNGVDVLVEALGVLRNRPPATGLGVLIIGKGGSTAAIAERIKALQLEDVEVSQPVAREEALALMAKADMAYAGGRSLDALYKYGTSVNKVMDYMMTGLPIVFPHYAYKGPVGESGAGIQLARGTPETVAEAIFTLAEMPAEERRQMGTLGRHYVKEHFIWPKIAAGYIDALTDGDWARTAEADGAIT
ncbi:glycosyltransferase family 4 protein [Brevundimonas halotolerans]|uniref:Glycosyltransferase involved in cell wall biosynthesis n=1 Tax=Brevundimonas halotolerans TaxID=69670 RepID=A0A7W9E7X6_9CAUL|nr:glycosyltransferase family 4 protein [Brevundimonas halotolerans]MBB5661418.1 glycosyltransferase involved in cell wall biosynthesis [Brevundimonas halotolerans]